MKESPPAEPIALAPMHMQAKSSRFLLATLFLLLVLVEVGPIWLFHHMDGLWLLNNSEDFDFLFWPSLNVAFVPSYFFYHVGTISWGFMKLIHAATGSLNGSDVVNLAYYQTFGYVVRCTYAALMLAVPLLYWWRRRDRLITAMLIVFALALHLATPNIFLIYHLRVGTQLTNKWLALATAALFFDTLRVFLQGGLVTTRRVAGSALFAGVLFLEIPSYVLLFLPFVIVSNGAATNVAAAIRRCLWWTAGGITGFLAGLVPFYGSDWRSATGAIQSLIRGLGAGFPQVQPGFREDFVERLFDFQSPYFWVHVALAAHLGFMLMLGGIALRCRSRMEWRTRFVIWTLLISFAFVFLAHMRIWATRGSYTSVFSLTYYSFYTVLAGVIALRAFGRQQDSPEEISFADRAAAAGLLIVSALLIITPIHFNFRQYMARQTAIAAGFRSLDAVVEKLPRPLTITLKSLTQAQGLMPGHMAMAGFLYHAGPGGWNGQDERYYSAIEKQRFPGLRMAWPQRALELHYNHAEWKLDGAIGDGWPQQIPGAVIAPLPKPLANELVCALEKSVSMMTLDLSTPTVLLQQSEGIPHGLSWPGPKEFPAARWLIIPLTDPVVRFDLLNLAWPDSWQRENYHFFLLTTYFGQFVLALPDQRPASD